MSPFMTFWFGLDIGLSGIEYTFLLITAFIVANFLSLKITSGFAAREVGAIITSGLFEISFSRLYSGQ